MRKRRNQNKVRNSSNRSQGVIATWGLRHLQALLSSLGRLSRAPFSTLMTVAVLSIALAFPTGLKLLLDNIQRLSGSMDSTSNISIFLKKDVDKELLQEIASNLRLEERISEVHVITPEEALEEFKRNSGFAEALDTLDKNPLPAVMIITPAAAHSTPEGAEALLQELKTIQEVDIAQLDLQWVRRFQALTEIAARGILLLSSLLGLAVLLIVGNTIRLEIQNQKDEIEITKLIGGTNAFIRRPFLYSGFWYGLFGGLLAWLLVALNILFLEEPVKKLAGLYHSSFQLNSLDAYTILLLILFSIILGLVGSWIAVGRHLHAIEPE